MIGMDCDIVKLGFFVIYIVLVIYYMMGGLYINIYIEVLDGNGNVILGLFVVGEVVGGLYGNNWVGGNLIVEIVIFGC